MDKATFQGEVRRMAKWFDAWPSSWFPREEYDAHDPKLTELLAQYCKATHAVQAYCAARLEGR